MNDREEEGKALYRAYMAAARAVNGSPHVDDEAGWIGLDEAQKTIWRMASAARGPGLEGEIEARPNSRERSLAKTYAETARLWLDKAPRFVSTPEGAVTP